MPMQESQINKMESAVFRIRRNAKEYKEHFW
jgi:hypothetical protein